MSGLLYKQADSEWSTSRNWYNSRVMDTFISSPIVDKQGDMIPTETLKESMNFYMKYGIYAYKHDEIPIGQPLAWRIKDDKVLLRVGIHNKLDMHDKIWKEIQQFGSKGASSIRGEALSQNQVCPPGESCFTKIDKLGLWSVSWVGDSPANPDATVREVAMAKTSKIEKIIERKDGKYCLYAKKDRKLLGCHDTKAGAIRQERAIQARRFSKSNELLDDILKTIKKSCTPRVIKTDSLKKSNDLLDDVMRMIKFGTFITKKKTPGVTWFNNCRMNAMKIERLPGRKQIRDKRAFCSELWYNPGRFDQTYKKPDGSTGKTSGMQFRLDMGTSSGPSGLHGR